MSLENSKANMRRFYEEVMNKGNFSVIDELSSDNAIDHSRLPGFPQGKEGTKQLMGMFRSAFPDLKATVEDIVGESDKLIARVTVSGTHKGEFMGIPPTGKSFTINSFDMIRVEPDGKSAEHSGLMDQAGMMQQLGLAPPPGKP